MGKSELQEAAKQIQASLLEARARAIESGVPQIFHYQPDGRRYEILSLEETDNIATSSALSQGTTSTPSSATAAANSAASSTSTASASNPTGASSSPALSTDQPTAPEPISETLPEGVVFVDPQQGSLINLTTGELNLPSSTVEDAVTGERWSASIQFGVNGRTTNTLLKIRGAKSMSIVIFLRGLMGTSLIGEPRREEETDQQSESSGASQTP
jgi:hypothetical protein